MSKSEHGELLTPQEVSKILRRSVKTLANWRSMKVGPPHIKKGPFVCYPKLLVDEWLSGGLIETREHGY